MVLAYLGLDDDNRLAAENCLIFDVRVARIAVATVRTTAADDDIGTGTPVDMVGT